MDGTARTPRTGRLIARDLWCTLRRQGASAALASLRQIARRRIYATVHELIVARPLTADGAAPASGPMVRIEHAGPMNLPAVAAFHRRQCMTRRTPLFEAALGNGVRSLLGFVGDELVGYVWWLDAAEAERGSYLTRFGMPLEDGDVFGYNLFIATEHRGDGTAAAFLDRAEAELGRLGYRRIVGTLDTSNIPARWLHQVRGYEVLRSCTTRIVLHRLVIVDGRPYLAARSGLRPLARGAPVLVPETSPPPAGDGAARSVSASGGFGGSGGTG